MPYATPNFFHTIVIFLALSLIASTSRQVAARNLLEMNLPDQSPQLGLPTLETPSLHKHPTRMTFPAFQEPLLPPHFFPILPFPSLPTIPSFPTPTGPSIPSFPTPTGPSIPSFPAIPGIPSSVPPAFPNPPAQMTTENPSTTPTVKNP
ncbi:hypothetical protein BVRB_6g131230 [Beta vulgaris subsp. vulgaris]|nr:hypothetical protein BVRB_6g131230 [Beta vulgaris subsp. vulgaris]